MKSTDAKNFDCPFVDRKCSSDSCFAWMYNLSVEYANNRKQSIINYTNNAISELPIGDPEIALREAERDAVLAQIDQDQINSGYCSRLKDIGAQ